jgi:hypothetical protein
VCPHARICKLKNPFYNPCRFLIDYQLIMAVRRFAVSERRIGAAAKPAFALARMDDRIFRELSLL